MLSLFKKGQGNSMWLIVTMVLVIFVLFAMFSIFGNKYSSLIKGTSCEANDGILSAKCDPRYSEEMRAFNEPKKGLKCCISNGFEIDAWESFKSGGSPEYVILGTGTNYLLTSDSIFIPSSDVIEGSSTTEGDIYIYQVKDDEDILINKDSIYVDKNSEVELKFHNTWWSGEGFSLSHENMGDFCTVNVTRKSGGSTKSVITLRSNCARTFKTQKLELKSLSGEIIVEFKVYKDEESYNEKEDSKDSRTLIIIFGSPCKDLEKSVCKEREDCFLTVSEICKSCTDNPACSWFKEDNCVENICDLGCSWNDENEKCFFDCKNVDDMNECIEENGCFTTIVDEAMVCSQCPSSCNEWNEFECNYNLCGKLNNHYCLWDVSKEECLPSQNEPCNILDEDDCEDKDYCYYSADEQLGCQDDVTDCIYYLDKDCTNDPSGVGPCELKPLSGSSLNECRKVSDASDEEPTASDPDETPQTDEEKYCANLNMADNSCFNDKKCYPQDYSSNVCIPCPVNCDGFNGKGTYCNNAQSMCDLNCEYDFSVGECSEKS